MKRIFFCLLFVSMFASCYSQITQITDSVVLRQYIVDSFATNNRNAITAKRLRLFADGIMNLLSRTSKDGVKYIDTSGMLSGYEIRGYSVLKDDTSTMLLAYVRKSDTSAMMLPYLRKGDTALMLSPYMRKSGANFVPYTGATGNVNLGSYGITATGYIRFGGFNDAGAYYSYEPYGNWLAPGIIGFASGGDMKMQWTQGSSPNRRWETIIHAGYGYGNDGFSNPSRISWRMSPGTFGGTPTDVISFGGNGTDADLTVSGRLIATGAIKGAISASASPASTYLTHTSGVIQSRTLTQVLSDIGGLSFADTASILSPYLRKSDTATMLAGYQRIGSGVVTGYLPYVGATEDVYMDVYGLNAAYLWASMETNGNVGSFQNTSLAGTGVLLQGGSTRSKYTAMFMNYLGDSIMNVNDSAIEVYRPLLLNSSVKIKNGGTYYSLADSADVAGKVNISDTASMLAGYQRIGTGGGGGGSISVYDDTIHVNRIHAISSVTSSVGSWSVNGSYVDFFGTMKVHVDTDDGWAMLSIDLPTGGYFAAEGQVWGTATVQEYPVQATATGSCYVYQQANDTAITVTFVPSQIGDFYVQYSLRYKYVP